MAIHVVELPLKTTKYDDYLIDKRFFAMWHLHNVMVKHAKKLLVQLNHNKEYNELLAKYIKLSKKDDLDKYETELKKLYSKQLTAIRQDIGLSEYEFQAYLKVTGKNYKHLVSSTQVQKEATFIWRGVEKVLFGDGKQIHFKKYIDMDTIPGKNATNGVKFNKEDYSIDWLGLHIKCKLPKKKKSKNNKLTEYDYIMESLNSKVKYCDVKRRMFNNGWHYYVLIYLDGPAPSKLIIGEDTMGIDPGISTVAGVGDNHIVLKELAPKSKEYNKKISKLQNRMDISKRNSNPDNFNKDGTVKKGKKTWTFSNTYKKNRNKLKALYRRKSEYIKHSHNALCNELLRHHNTFIVEAMNFKALQKRAKDTKRQDKATDIKQKDGSIKSIYKYKKKRRFGKSINDRSPGLFIAILKQKCLEYGGTFKETNTVKMRASQYNHVTDSYEKVPLSVREKNIGGKVVQRDLYSAFLHRYADKSLEKVDRDLCNKNFDHFIEMHNALIEEMKVNKITMKQCFGF